MATKRLPINGHVAVVGVKIPAAELPAADPMVGDRDRVKAGFHGYIAKPIEPTTFAAQIKSFFVPAPHPATAGA